jgi:serine-type D-Ala-D-Ala carboxypeptidase/endopeptidase
MKRKIFKWLFITIGFVIGIVLFLAVFIYFSVSDRVKLYEPDAPVENSRRILRLDSTSIAPDSLTNQIQLMLDKANVQGLGISIINNHKVVYQQYFGSRNVSKGETFFPGTIWYGASLSKTIFADVVLQLEEDGVLHLDTPLQHYSEKPVHKYCTNTVQQVFGANFIDYTDLQGDDRVARITARHCLSHTTGLPNWRWLEPDKKLKIKSDPGSRYSYSGEGMFLLQVVVEEITGRSVEGIAFEKVFKPLGMERSSYVWQRSYEGNYAVGHDQHGNDLRIPKQNTPNAAGSMSTTLEDYTRYFAAVLRQDNQRYTKLLQPQVRIRSKQQFGPNALIDVSDNDSIRLSSGLGFGLYESPFGKAFFKEGHLDGWQHYAVGFPSSGTGLVILSNSDQAESIFKDLIEVTTGNRSTPWFWEGYMPFGQSASK